jgi:hypothetical protein
MADRKLQNMRGPRSTTLADLLERILDTGIVVAGDIKVNLNDVELLTVQIRLVICSVDKADQMGLDWWKSANYLQGSAGESDAGETVPAATQEQFEALNDRLGRLEQTMGRLAAQAEDGDDGA